MAWYASDVGRAAGWLYLLVAFVLPLVVPLAVLLGERDAARRRWMWFFVALGAIVSSLLVSALLQHGFAVAARAMHLDYRVRGFDGVVIAFFYVAACVAQPSSHDGGSSCGSES